jgi:hypothetical protein
MNCRTLAVRVVWAGALLGGFMIGCAGNMNFPPADPNLRMKFAADEVRADSNGLIRLPLVIINEGTEVVDLPMFDSCFQIATYNSDSTFLGEAELPKFGHVSELSKDQPVLKLGDTLKLFLTFEDPWLLPQQIVREWQYKVVYKVGDKRSGKVIWRRFGTKEPVTVRW